MVLIFKKSTGNLLMTSLKSKTPSKTRVLVPIIKETLITQLFDTRNDGYRDRIFPGRWGVRKDQEK